MKQGKRVNDALIQAFEHQIGPERFGLWFKQSVQMAMQDDTLQVLASNKFILDWLRRSFKEDLEVATQAVLGGPVQLEFSLAAGLSQTENALAESASSPASNPKSNGKKSLQLRVYQKNGSTHSVNDTTTEKTQKSHSKRSPKSRQREHLSSPASRPGSQKQPSSSNRRSFGSLQEFVSGRSNRLALTSAEMVIERPGTLSPLFFYGPPGVGKTHLLEGIYGGLKRQNRRIKALFLSAEQFTTEFVESVRSGMPSFRRKYRSLDLLILDDLQFFRGKQATIGELYHTIDTLARQGRQVALSADSPPHYLTELGPELISRLTAGMVCSLEPPEWQTRLGIARRFAKQLELQIPEEVLEHLAHQFTTHARELAGALHRIKATARALRRPISLDLVNEALNDLFPASLPVVQADDVVASVCRIFQLTPELMQSKRRSNRIAQPRMLAMWLIRKHTNASFSEIGSLFSRRHSTAIAASKRVDEWVKGSEMLELGTSRIHINDAIERIESSFRS
ncbi:Chromosomal replication initiator protein DnaA [Planctomycetales bacterium 10988]|nr:Chromosomal replication initiator protein DnaA [Planctomycetales bacterium 10988]